jgi:hypothetical protein
VSRRLALEFETCVGGSFSALEYTYLPSPSLRAHVAASGKDTFYSFQLRGLLGIVEPVAGVAWVHSTATRHATFDNGRVYFDDHTSHEAVAFAGGVDARLKITSHVAMVPTFRFFLVPRPEVDPFAQEYIRASPVVLRYGIGARVSF